MFFKKTLKVKISKPQITKFKFLIRNKKNNNKKTKLGLISSYKYNMRDEPLSHKYQNK